MSAQVDAPGAEGGVPALAPARGENPAQQRPGDAGDAFETAAPAPADAGVHVTPADAGIDSAADHGEATQTAAPERGAAEAVEGVIAAQREGSWPEFRARVETSVGNLVEAARVQLPRRTRGAVDHALRVAGSEEVQETLTTLLGVLLVALLTLRLLRGRGDLAVAIEYPSELRGTFSVRVAKSRAKAKAQNRRAGRIKTPEHAQRAKRNAGLSSRTEHTMVSRETQFRDLAARTYFVTVDGFVQAYDGEEVLNTYFEEQEIRIRRRRTVRVEFDFHPKDCPIDVRILWDRRPVEEALVALLGVPGSLRYARGGPVRLGVPRGTHTLVVGGADRVAERVIEVNSFRPKSVSVDLTGRENVLFTGCPPAVEPYLNGDIPAAARALEREGQTEISNLLLARMHLERDQKDIAARHFEAAGRDREAAELHRDLANFRESAALFENAGEIAQAAEMYRSAGDLIQAGEAYERAHRFDSAVECYRDAGDVAKWIESLERQGAAFEAAQVSIERGEWGRAIRSLQLVTHSDVDYVEAANLLVEAYEREGHLDMAAEKIEEIIRNHGADQVPLEICDRLAARLEEHGEYERALDMLEVVRRRDATFPNVATRIEGLRKRRSNERSTQVAGVFGAAGSPPFSEGFRYEILEEIGRGGMGIVFKARDRRLGRIVALKRLPDNLRNHPKAIDLFLREARAAAALNHPNIVTLFDAAQEGDTFYITMELLEGSPLQTILRNRGRLTPRDTARLGVQVANGLQYAHEQRIIHRDIKTGNLFFTNNKKVKIMDFGLAKMVEEVRRASTVIGGTPYYMAPEQALGRSVDHRADIYALGVTLFELLTGKVPFVDGDVAYQHRHTPPPNPRERCEDIPDELAELVLHLLAKSPDDRCGSAARVAQRLKEISEALR